MEHIDRNRAITDRICFCEGRRCQHENPYFKITSYTPFNNGINIFLSKQNIICKFADAFIYRYMDKTRERRIREEDPYPTPHNCTIRLNPPLQR